MTLQAYLPQDRFRALARGESLPDRTLGSALFADISGFTPLTEALRDSMGPRRGAEEMTRYLRKFYTALIGEVEHYGGSVIDFAGDAIMCWFDRAHGPAEARAMQCALALQQVMQSFRAIHLPDGKTIEMAIKVAVASGPARRFIVGDAAINFIDALAGSTVVRTSAGESLAKKGDTLADEATVQALGPALTVSEWRTHSTPEADIRFGVVKDFHGETASPAVPEFKDPPPDSTLKAWLPEAVYERERAGQESLMTEFRPCVALFVRFSGIDYDSDEAGGQLNTLIQLMQAKVRRFGGTLFQTIIGDKGSYAYINVGALTMHEDDCRRAVKLALALREAARSLEFIAPLQIGVTQGIMFVGWYGSATRKVFGAVGDDVNLAARFMTTAAPGEILISGRVRKAIAEEFLVEARPPISIKGKAEPIPVYSVQSEQQKRSVRLQEPDYSLPMIGRGKDLELIAEKLSLAIRGKGQVVGITGEAGMGKSRLVAEGIRLAHKSKLIGYGGACKSDGVNTPYLVWMTIWNAFFDVDPAMPLRKQIRSIEFELEDWAPENLDALPLLGSILGLPLPENEFTQALQPKDRKSQLETLLIKCLEFSARESAESGGGLLLVLEDLHWIDPISSDLLELIAGAIENLPILILLTYRPPATNAVQQPTRHLKEMAHFTEIELNELNAAESEQVIRGKLSQLFPEQRGGAPRFLVERVTARAQGNPFYVEELLNYLHDKGVDPRDARVLNSLELPDSLYSLILSRIDQLSATQQFSLKVASIIGRIFRFDHLYYYYQALGSGEDVKLDLQAMNRVDLTLLESPEPELVYIFKHLVTHEVAYESIAYATRAKLHGMYARYLEETQSEQIERLVPQLAHHYEKAQVQEKALYYLNKAGEQAAASFANEEALSYFSRALNADPDTSSRFHFDVLMKRERVYDLLGRRPEQRSDLTELSRLANTFEDSALLRTQLFIRNARLEIDEGNYPAAKANAQAAIREVESGTASGEQASHLLVDALLLEARAMFLSGQAIDSKPQLDNALSRAREHQYLRGEYNALAQLGLWNWYNGDNKTAIDLIEQSLVLIRQAGDVRRELEILNNLGIVEKDMYHFNDAIAHYEKAQKIAKKIGDRSGEASLLNNMGRASIVFGDFASALLHCSRAEILAAAVNDPNVQGIAMHNMSEAYRELGQYSRAKEAAEESLRLLRSVGYPVGEAYTLENLALVEFALGTHNAAFERAEQALAITREINARRVEVSVLTRIGLMRLQLGQTDGAEEVLLAANKIEEEYKETIPLFEIQAGLAGVALNREDSAAANAIIQELARELLQQPPSEQSHILPLWMYLTCIRVMRASEDPHAVQLIRRANEELQERREKISDDSFHEQFLNIPEHRSIIDLAAAQTQ